MIFLYSVSPVGSSSRLGGYIPFSYPCDSLGEEKILHSSFRAGLAALFHSLSLGSFPLVIQCNMCSRCSCGFRS